MRGYTFNQQLHSLRLSQGLSRKEAAKAMGLTRLRLFLYEKGYFRPRGKAKEKIESYYGTTLDFEKENDYPSAINDENKPVFARKKRVVAYGIVTFAMAAILAVGTTMFVRSTKNDASLYGESYAALYQVARDSGKAGTEIVTNAPYHYVQAEDNNYASILFYDSSSFLHFNECRYAVNVYFIDHPELGWGRLDYRFGGDLASPSRRCYFTYGNTDYGSVLSCDALYDGQPVERVEHFKVHVAGNGNFDEETVKWLFNYYIGDAVFALDKILQRYFGENVSFMNHFVKDREQGRTVAFTLQLVGLSLLVVGLLGLFAGLSLLAYSLLRRLHLRQAVEVVSPRRELPKDFHIPVAIPDFLLLGLVRALFVVSLLFLAISFLGKVGVGLAPVFYDATFLSVLRTAFMVTPFLWLLFVCRCSDDGGKILSEMTKSFLVFFFLAGMETMLIAVTNAWGYDFSALVYDYVPGSVFQVVALLFLIHFFLAFTPRFLQGRGTRAVVLWRLLSLLPLGLLAASVIVSNAHNLFYDVPQNIFISFWFPSSVLPATMASVFLIYGSFFLRLCFKRRYGPFYLNGDRFALWDNLLSVLVLLLVYGFIILLRGNEYAYYLGLVNGEWMLTLVPFFLLCKSAPRPCVIPMAEEVSST